MSSIKSNPTPQKTGGGIPKLNLKGLKQNQEYRDWYQYALKLEDSVKFLRQRIEVLEEDLETANAKYRQEKKANTETLEINQRLVAALNTSKQRVHEIKAKYRNKAASKCINCGQRYGGRNNSSVNDSMSVGSDVMDRGGIARQQDLPTFEEYSGTDAQGHLSYSNKKDPYREYNSLH